MSVISHYNAEPTKDGASVVRNQTPDSTPRGVDRGDGHSLIPLVSSTGTSRPRYRTDNASAHAILESTSDSNGRVVAGHSD